MSIHDPNWHPPFVTDVRATWDKARARMPAPSNTAIKFILIGGKVHHVIGPKQIEFQFEERA